MLYNCISNSRSKDVDGSSEVMWTLEIFVQWMQIGITGRQLHACFILRQRFISFFFFFSHFIVSSAILRVCLSVP